MVRSDFTEEGFEFMKQWEKHVELSPPIDDVSNLTAELEMMLSRHIK
jgi:hypothetical protein